MAVRSAEFDCRGGGPVITRDDRGVFEALLADGRFVRGWAATVEEMVAILCRYGETEPYLAGTAVSTVVAADDLDNVCAGKLYDHSEEWDERLDAAAIGPQRVMLREKLIRLWARVPADPEQLRAWLGELTDQVNAAAPQVKEVSVFDCPGTVAYERS
uniref:hypothetical protein n=1 Tax=Nocardia suismassiliense TaxID=2077092 RepID=UPI003F49935F